jgi:hypothetical protein
MQQSVICFWLNMHDNFKFQLGIVLLPGATTLESVTHGLLSVQEYNQPNKDSEFQPKLECRVNDC